MTDTKSTCARREIPAGAPLRTKVAGVLALLACVGCCALPYLIVAGVLTGAGAAIAQQALIAAAAALAVLALGMWWLYRSRRVRTVTSGCGDAGCAC
ncbi:hypothetical protein AAIB33_03765 [Microbacterium sp. AZCO]|uniref:hypothetical protein n=1 Tax=Microbacterium sp. AZCO TaxID=3142976 RepID=UPI0031F3ED60